MALCIGCNKEISSTATRCRFCYVETFPTVTRDVLITSTGSVEGYEIKQKPYSILEGINSKLYDGNVGLKDRFGFKIIK